MKSIVFATLILFFWNDCRSQEYNYFHYDVKAGLSGITIYTIAQDKDGFLWFGTETGLSRFDGNNFTSYKANEGLNDNEIIYLFVDSKNRVWIFPFNNSVYYYLDGKIFNASNDSLLKSFHIKNEIFKAAEDKNGNIFFLETDKLHIVTKHDKLIEIDKIGGRNFFNNGCGISATGECNLLISFSKDIANHRINSYEYRDSQFRFLNVIQDYNFTRNTIEINPFYKLFRNQDVFEIFYQKTQERFNVKVPNHFHTLSFLDDSCLAISTSEKTFLFNIKQKKITDSFLTNTTVNKCYKDKEGNLWFATMSQGVYRLSSTNFKVFSLQNGAAKISVHSIQKSEGGIYIGAEKGLLWNMNFSNNSFEKVPVVTDYDLNRISAIQVSKNKDLFLGTDNGLFKKEDNAIKNYFPRTVIKSLFLHNDSLIFASDRNVLDIPLKNVKGIDTIWKTRAICACKLNNEYYVGTLSGLYFVENGKKHAAVSLGKTYPELNDKIISLVPQQNGELWVATESFGLLCLEKDKIKYRITTVNGLTSNACRCVFIDGQTIWLGTEKGISKIDISHAPFQITQFTTAEGLDCEIINCIYAHNDSVFVGTPFGLTFFNAAKIQRQSICKLKLLDIQSKNGDWFSKRNSIRLKANDNSLLFEYAAISFVSSADITYYYQLKGLDNIWRSTKQNSIAFDLLPAGSYILKMYAKNKYGVKSNIIVIPFTKAKEFWHLLWVRGLLLVIFCFVVWLIASQRIRHVRNDANRKILLERKINELEQMALRAQMNPHFIFNSLNSIQQYIFSGNVLEANQFITNFSSLIRQTLYISGKKFIKLDDEIQYLESYLSFEQCKYDNSFDFKIFSDEKTVSENIVIPPLLLQPYIENSIRHGLLNLKGRHGMIDIYFLTQNGLLTCIIKDNGIGREESSKLKSKTVLRYQSKGMELVQKRIENLNIIYNTFITVLIEDLKGDETGTSVTIKLPLTYDE